jgi:hypothetical protein
MDGAIQDAESPESIDASTHLPLKEHLLVPGRAIRHRDLDPREIRLSYTVLMQNEQDSMRLIMILLRNDTRVVMALVAGHVCLKTPTDPRSPDHPRHPHLPDA